MTKLIMITGLFLAVGLVGQWEVNSYKEQSKSQSEKLEQCFDTVVELNYKLTPVL